MIFWDLFIVFSKIGFFNYGGGYAMLSLIQDEIVRKHQWLSATEFTDIVAVSQMTPGPIGINAATYVGYTAVVEQGYCPILGIVGSLIATVSVLWLPLCLMLAVSQYLLRARSNTQLQSMFSLLRPTIVGLVAAAALELMTVENFASPSTPIPFACSLALFALGFLAIYRYKLSPLLIISVAGLLGIVVYEYVLPS